MEYPAKDKYYSMERSYKRLQKISINNGNSIKNTDARDAVEDFFYHCYHFKDWIKKDSSITLIEDIEDFINNSDSLSLAADYCNSFKHAGLNKKSRSKDKLEKINTHINLDLTQTGFISYANLEITIGNKSYDAFTLATLCVNDWNYFLKQNNIYFEAP